VEGLAVPAPELKPMRDHPPVAFDILGDLALRHLRGDLQKDRDVEPRASKPAVDAERLRRKGALAALAQKALHSAPVARTRELAAALVLE
jgi:hypothetical protein